MKVSLRVKKYLKRTRWSSSTSVDAAVGSNGTTIIEVRTDRAENLALHRSIGPGGLEIGYWLHPERTGRGLATRATAALVGHAFALPDIDHVQVWHDAANVAGGAVPKRLGFTQVDRRTPPRDPMTPGEVGIDVIWQLDRPE